MVQNRAPAGSGAPQPPHGPADLRATGAASELRGGRGGGGAACGVGETTAGAVGAVVAAGLAGALGPPGGVALGAAFTITGTGAISDSPHEGQTTHVGSSTIFRQFRQRFGANGSGWPQ